jgi:hypothetical protein
MAFADPKIIFGYPIAANSVLQRKFSLETASLARWCRGRVGCSEKLRMWKLRCNLKFFDAFSYASPDTRRGRPDLGEVCGIATAFKLASDQQLIVQQPQQQRQSHKAPNFQSCSLFASIYTSGLPLQEKLVEGH